GPLMGSNFWAWGGEGRAAHPDHRFAPGDRLYVGDPMHEPQGWYSVFDVDESTKAVIKAHSAELARMS
ncbi:MAG: mannanase, partial [Alphaproteobacteria bacterium]|nr:mannanase [Alphaproteobacteria bacterium]